MPRLVGEPLPEGPSCTVERCVVVAPRRFDACQFGRAFPLPTLPGALHDRRSFGRRESLLLQITRQALEPLIEEPVELVVALGRGGELVVDGLAAGDEGGHVATGHEQPAGRHVERRAVDRDPERPLHVAILRGRSTEPHRDRILPPRRRGGRDQGLEPAEDLLERHNRGTSGAGIGGAGDREALAVVSPRPVLVVPLEPHGRLGVCLPLSAVEE